MYRDFKGSCRKSNRMWNGVAVPLPIPLPVAHAVTADCLSDLNARLEFPASPPEGCLFETH